MAIVGHLVHETQDFEPLKRAYHDVLYKNNIYVDPAYREPPEDKPDAPKEEWVARPDWHELPEALIAKIKQPQDGVVPLFIAVEDTDAKKMVGMGYALYFPKEQAGLVVYPYQIKGKGSDPELSHTITIALRELIESEAEKRGQVLHGVGMEVYDPKLVDADMKAQERKNRSMYESWDAKEIGAANNVGRVSYVQAAVNTENGTAEERASADRDKTMMLFVFPKADGTYPDLDAAVDINRGIYRYTGAQDAEIDTDPHYKGVANDIANKKRGLMLSGSAASPSPAGMA